MQQQRPLHSHQQRKLPANAQQQLLVVVACWAAGLRQLLLLPVQLQLLLPVRLQLLLLLQCSW
jgi:hypothetical protein